MIKLMDPTANLVVTKYDDPNDHRVMVQVFSPPLVKSENTVGYLGNIVG